MGATTVPVVPPLLVGIAPPAVAPAAYPGPLAIMGFPGMAGRAERTSSLAMALGRSSSQEEKSETDWMSKSGQSSILPDRLVQVLTADWRNASSQPIMKSPW